MTRQARGRFLLRTAGRTLRLVVLSGALAYAQSSTPALPNMGQDLTPIGAFVPLNPGLADHPEWTATHAVSSVVSPLGDTMLVLTSGFNRVYNNPLTKLPLLSAWDPKDSAEHVFVYDLTTPTPSLKQGVHHQYALPGGRGRGAAGKYLQRDCLRSNRLGFLRGGRSR